MGSRAAAAPPLPAAGLFPDEDPLAIVIDQPTGRSARPVPAASAGRRRTGHVRPRPTSSQAYQPRVRPAASRCPWMARYSGSVVIAMNALRGILHRQHEIPLAVVRPRLLILRWRPGARTALWRWVRSLIVFLCGRVGRIRGGRGDLAEVEVAGQVPEAGRVLAHRRARVRATVGLRIEPLAAEEVILDELGERIEAQLLVIDEAASGHRG